MGWTAPGLTWKATIQVLCQPDIPYFLISEYKGALGGCSLDCGRCCVGAPGFCTRSSHCYPRAWEALDMQPAACTCAGHSCVLASAVFGPSPLLAPGRIHGSRLSSTTALSTGRDIKENWGLVDPWPEPRLFQEAPGRGAFGTGAPRCSSSQNFQASCRPPKIPQD